MQDWDAPPSIGVVLCKSKDKTIAEYTLRSVNTPISVTTHRLPDQRKAHLPTIKQLHFELDKVVSELS